MSAYNWPISNKNPQWTNLLLCVENGMGKEKVTSCRFLQYAQYRVFMS